jgi:hypothetical protein
MPKSCKKDRSCHRRRGCEEIVRVERVDNCCRERIGCGVGCGPVGAYGAGFYGAGYGGYGYGVGCGGPCNNFYGGYNNWGCNGFNYPCWGNGGCYQWPVWNSPCGNSYCAPQWWNGCGNCNNFGFNPLCNACGVSTWGLGLGAGCC